MKTYLLLPVFLCVTCFVKAQNHQALDTIYANDQKNVALFFPAPIRQGITGTENFVFTYNREKQQFFGLLQAKPGKESNLLIVDTEGSVFSYIIKYKRELDRLNYFISPSNSIGREKPIVSSAIGEKNPEKQKNFDQGKEYEEFCAFLLRGKKKTTRLKRSRYGMSICVENIVFNKEKLFFVIHIENKSRLDYDVDFLQMSIRTGKKGKTKSMQSLRQEPLFCYHFPTHIKGQTSTELVYVVPKFSLPSGKFVVVELNERMGERNLKLKIRKKFINHPY